MNATQNAARDHGSSSSTEPPPPPQAVAAEADLAAIVLKKIDRTIIPLLFITYMFNFMDKIILSSAAVFGLREDTVSNGAPSSTTASLC